MGRDGLGVRSEFLIFLNSSEQWCVLFFLWLVCILISIFYCFKCFKPQIELKYNKNVFFFGDAISAFGNTEEYTKRLIEVCASEEELFTQLGEQIHVECKIIAAKFKCIRHSIKFFALSFIFITLIMGYLLIILLFNAFVYAAGGLQAGPARAAAVLLSLSLLSLLISL